jgi:hypothetical protein
MLEMYRYVMHIIDKEFDDEYDYEGLFHDHFEADRFLTENENVGNEIIIYKIEKTMVKPEVLNQIFRD